MKKTIMSIIGKVLAVIMVCALFGGMGSVVSVSAKSPELSTTKKTIYTGEKFTLKLNNVSGKITWKTSNKKVATVKDGVVTAVKAGKVTVSANYKGAAYNCKITVKAPRINCKEATLFTEGTLQLKVYGKEVKSYKSSNSEVATVSSTGEVTAVAYGEAEISVTCKDGKVYYCKVTVNDAYDKQIPLSNLDYFDKTGDYYINDGGGSFDYSKDNTGKTHKDFISVGSSYTHGSVVYLTEKAYSRLTGVFYIIYDKRSISSKAELTILGDEKKLWQGTVKAGVEPIRFNVDISKVEKLEIYTDGNIYSAIGDLYLVP